MSLSSRERRYLQFCGLFVGGVLFYLLVLLPLWRGWFEARAERLKAAREFAMLAEATKAGQALSERLDAVCKSLGVKVPEGSPPEQRAAFVRAVEQAAGRSRVQITNWVQQRTRASRPLGSRDGAGSTESFNATLQTDQAGLVAFLKALSELEHPVVATRLEVKNNENEPDKVKGVIELQTWIFAENPEGSGE